MHTSRLMLALLSTCLAANLERVATAQVATASVTGEVVDQSDGPVVDATVTLYAPLLPGGKRAMQTDGAGGFSFQDLAGGSYRIGVSKQGFVPMQDGQRHWRYDGRPFPLRDGERRDVVLRLPRLGVITGRIVDARGSPMVNASVRALEISMSAGYRRILSKAEARTDDRGIYRLHSLWPNSYLVCASTRSTIPPEAFFADRIDPVRGHAPSCHQDATGARSTFTIGPGDERAGVDLRLADTRLARIEGSVTGLAPGPELQVTGQLLNLDEALGDVIEGASVAGNGRFRFRNIPPGRYAMVLTQRPSAPGPSKVRWLAAAPLTVASEDLTDIVIDVPKSATVRGEVVLRGKTDPASALVSRVEVRLEPARHDALTRYVGPYTVSPDASGRFEFPAVAPGSYHLSAGFREQPATWFVDAITLDGRDLLVDAVEVKPGQTVGGAVATLTQQRGSLAGTLLNETGEPVPGAAVLVYPVDERYRGLNARQIRYASASPDGDYVAAGLRPGNYRVATIVAGELGAWYEPEFLRQLDATAVPLSIAADERKILNLRVPDR